MADDDRILADEATERAVLAACLIADWALEQVLLEVEPRHFAFDRHRRIYGAMRSLDRDGTVVDLTTLQSRLGEQGVADCGGPAYLATLDVDLPDLGRIDSYVAELKRWATRRDLHNFAVGLAGMVSDQQRSVTDLVEDAESLFELAAHGGRQALDVGFPGETELIIERVADGVEERFAGVPTGLTDLDRITLGMEPGHLWCLAGRPSTGKSLVGGVIARNVASERPVLWFSLEMTRREVFERILSREVCVPYHRVRKRAFSDGEREAIRGLRPTLGKLPIAICERAGLRASEIVSMCNRYAQRSNGIGLVIVDYLGLMDHGTKKGENEATSIGRTCHALKNMAMQLRVPVLMLAQMNRESEHRSNRRPVLADLRGSGDIEQDSDVVVMLYREVPEPGRERLNGDADTSRVLELHVTKNRHGAIGMVQAWFCGETMEIRDFAPDPRQPPPYQRPRDAQQESFQ